MLNQSSDDGATAPREGIEPRLVHLERALNTRDIGGYPTESGESMKFGKIYRSSELSYLTDKDVEKVGELGLSHVVDFRGLGEADDAPDRLPDGVKVECVGSCVKVTGPKGGLQQDCDPAMTVAVKDGVVTVTRPSDKPEHRAKHGLTRALINNMVIGVSQGFERMLEIQAP